MDRDARKVDGERSTGGARGGAVPGSRAGSVARRLEGLAEELVGLGGEDAAELRDIRDRLAAELAETPGPMAAEEQIKAALDGVERVLGGASSAADADATLIAVTQSLALAARRAEGAGAGGPHAPAQAEPPDGAPRIEAPIPSQRDWGPLSQSQYVPAGDDQVDEGLVKEFIACSREHLATIESALLALESAPGDAEQINRVLRAFHTIKGSSGFLGLTAIGGLAHRAENLLDRARRGEIQLSGDSVDLALLACDTLRTMTDALATAEDGQAPQPPAHLADLMARLPDPREPGVCEAPDVQQMRLGEIPVGQGPVDRDRVGQVVRQPGSGRLGEALVDEGAVPAGDVATALGAQKQLAGGAPGPDSSVRVRTALLENLINMVGEMVVAHSILAQNPDLAGLIRQRQGRRRAGGGERAFAAGRAAARVGSGRRLAKQLSGVSKIVRELQDLAMSLRMVPLRPTFQKMLRMVRDLARKSGKPVRFVTEGEDTEIDRNMVEALNDPLVHLIRNAVDHGVEGPAERAALGKDETAVVTLRAYHSGSCVAIELEDDGRGLDRDRILAKAVEGGLVDAGAELSDAQVFSLIFAPGFSTAPKVTDLSGRGVGLDVVKRNLAKLRGRIEVRSRPSQGCTFTLRMPLTTAVTDAMVVRVGSQRYLLPLASIEQSFRPGADAVKTAQGRGEMVRYRDELVPVHRLHALFGVAGARTDPAQARLVIVEAGTRRFALMVDELLNQQQVVIKALGGALGDVPGVSGGAILGDGRVGLILDVPGLRDLVLGSAREPLAAAV